jgi:serine/threonine-protein kinase
MWLKSPDEDRAKFAEIADDYDERYDPACMARLFRDRHFPEEVNKFHKRFDCMSVGTLLEFGCSAERANKYPEDIPPHELPIAVIMGINPEDFHDNKDAWLPLVRRLYANHEAIRVMGMTFGPFSCIGMGQQGILVMGEHSKSAYKIGRELDREIRLYEKLEAANENIRNIVNMKQIMIVEKGLHIMELEYVQGKTLAELLERGAFGADKTIHYAGGILNGLAELFRAGIFHRDVWLENVMIDEVKDRAVIIDLGIATDDPEDGPIKNRRYGGENDLQSLGQIAYKMATGRHIFNPTTDKSTRFLSEQVKAMREKAYADPATLEKRLKMVEQNVPDERLSRVIKICLTAKGERGEYLALKEMLRIP